MSLHDFFLQNFQRYWFNYLLEFYIIETQFQASELYRTTTKIQIQMLVSESSDAMTRVLQDLVSLRMTKDVFRARNTNVIQKFHKFPNSRKSYSSLVSLRALQILNFPKFRSLRLLKFRGSSRFKGLLAIVKICLLRLLEIL